MSLENYEVNGYKVAIHQDEMAESPDQWENEDVFLVYDHRDFTVEREGFDPEEIFERMQTKKKTFDGYWFFPVYAYIHSGVALSLGRNRYPFNDQWDTSFKGFALVKRQKGWSYTSAKAYKIAQSIVEEWNQYLSGDVYGFEITDPQGNDVDSCWGFYGMDYMKEEISGIIAHDIAKRFKERCTQLKTFIRQRVPLEVRQTKLLNA